MEFMDYEVEYKDLEDALKIEKLMEFWKIDKPVLKGYINKSTETYFFIDEVRDLYENQIINPFTQRYIDRVYCRVKKGSSTLYDSLGEYDYVAFKFKCSNSKKPDTDKDSPKNKPIEADYSSIRNLLYWEELVDEAGENCQEFVEFIENTYVNGVVFEKDVLNVLEDSNNKLLEDINSKVEILEKLTKEIKTNEEIRKQNSLKDEEERIKRLQAVDDEVADKRKKEFSKAEQELEKNKTILENIRDEIKKYELLGFNLNLDKENNKNKSNEVFTTLDKIEQIEYIHKHLGVRNVKRLYYEKYIIEQFYSALCTNQIIVLCGKPGTGKTSLVEGFAESISAQYRIVSVQPSWTDNQDLLGFYNPIEKAYVSTPFLDTIIEASENPEKLYLICLDEMNLSHVEYYFSEFLSKLQLDDKTIHLYSDYLYQQLGQELHSKISEKYKNVENQNVSDIETILLSVKQKDDQYYKLKWQWDMYIKYPSKIKVPDNVRFVGALNKDETTKDLSPKVLDRSYVIELNELDDIKNDLLEMFEGYEEEYKSSINLNSSNFQIKREESNNNVLTKFTNLKRALKNVNIYLNERFENQLQQIAGSKAIDSDDKLYDYVISGMILPKINIETTGNDDRFIKEFDNLIKDTKVSKRIFNKMKKFNNSEKTLTFWR